MPVATRKAPRPHPLIRETVCACRRPASWIERPNGKRVLVDPHAACFLIFSSAGGPVGLTLREFQERVASITLRNGKTMDPSRILAMRVNHFATCAAIKRKPIDAAAAVPAFDGDVA